jgi:threonine aldolase
LYLIYVCWIDGAGQSAEEERAGWERRRDGVSVKTGEELAIGVHTELEDRKSSRICRLTKARRMALHIWSTQELWLVCSHRDQTYVFCTAKDHTEEPMLLVEMRQSSDELLQPVVEPLSKLVCSCDLERSAV